jgi:hypothetical protein
MTAWYVRPDTSHSVTRNGTSYATAWGSWSEIVWGGTGVVAGDTLYLCGAHTYTAQTTIGAHGATSDANRTTIRGDYAADPGSITFTGAAWIDSVRNYTSLVNLRIIGTTTAGYNCIYQSASAGFVADGCTFSGADNGITLGSGTAFTSCSIRNCAFSGHTNAAINQSISTASVNSAGIIVSGNVIHDTGFYGIQLSIATAALDTARLTDYLVSGNTVYNTPGASIYLRACKNDTTTVPGIYSAGLVISGNTVYNCGTVAGASGKHGGLLVMGFSSPLVTGNTVRDTYVTGAGIQTAKNLSPTITFNTISGIRSGTDAASYQGGYPIDGNGIFFDNLTIGGLAFGNHVSDLVSTGDPNSGCGLAIWTATGASYIGNVVENCNRGVFYGRAEETGNVVQNNTFIDCDVGIWKVGTSALTGNITVNNNILHNCTTGFSMGANPSITADYNNVYGHVTAYSGISAGANDKSVDPLLTSYYKPTAASLLASASPLGGSDFYGIPFKSTPNFGAVETTTPRSASSRSAVDSTLRPVSTRVAVRRGAAQ